MYGLAVVSHALLDLGLPCEDLAITSISKTGAGNTRSGHICLTTGSEAILLALPSVLVLPN